MKNTKSKILSAIIAFAMLISCASFAYIEASADESDNIVITIDPGHGGDDPGNTGASVLYGNGAAEHYESKHVYDISLYVKERLLQYVGVTVHLTRSDLDESVPVPSVTSRPDIALSYNSDAIVSIHTNAFDTTASGAEIHVPLKSVSYNNAIAVESHNAAQIVLNSIVDQTGIKSRGLKWQASTSLKYSNGETADHLGIIRQGRKNGIPVVMLIETAFADNEGDFNNYLSTTEKRQAMGYAIADGLATYYGLSLGSNAETPFVGKVQKINNKSYISLEASPTHGIITLDAAENNIKTDGQRVQINGWLGVDGGVSEYLYSVKGGAYESLHGGADGEPSADFYASAGLNDATKMGMFLTDSDSLVVDLSYYQGQTVTLSFAARALATNEIIPFLLISNYTVPIDIPANLVATYGQKLSSISLPDHLEWVSPSSSVGNAGSVSHSATFTASDGSTHRVSIKINVKKAVPTYSSPEPVEGQLKATLSSIPLPDGWSWAEGDTVLDTLGKHSFDIVFTPADSNNYSTISSTLMVNVKCSAHIYENSCDATCECGFVREITHTYQNECDPSCDICGYVRDISHAYDNGIDNNCNICGIARKDDPNADGCGSSIYSGIAVIASVAIGYIVTRKKKYEEG